MDHHYLNEELIKATKNNHPDEMLRLIEAGADVNYKDEFGVAALHWATNHADSHTIEVLVEHGADVNVQNAQGMTKLMQMSSFGDASIVSYLLEHGADAGMKDFSGKDAVSYAKEALDFGKDMPSERMGAYQEVIQMLEAQIAYDKLPENCFWFALDDEKCISVWYAPDQDDGDQFQMKLEERAEDGSMGAHCELIIDESYGTRDLSFGAVCKTLWEVCVDAEFSDDKADEVVSRVAKEIFANYGLEVPVVDRKKAIEIAEDFLKRMNPDGWDGVGKRPKNFDTRIVTYDVGSPYNDELDICFEKEINPDTGKKEWMHYCELRDKESGDVMIPMHGYGVNSVQNLADTIWDICKDFALDKDMEITINFGNLPMELKNMNLKLCFVTGTNGLFLQDEQNKMFQIEDYLHGSYLDNMIKNHVTAKFQAIDNTVIQDWRKEIWDWKDVEAFMKRQGLNVHESLESKIAGVEKQQAKNERKAEKEIVREVGSEKQNEARRLKEGLRR